MTSNYNNQINNRRSDTNQQQQNENENENNAHETRIAEDDNKEETSINNEDNTITENIHNDTRNNEEINITTDINTIVTQNLNNNIDDFLTTLNDVEQEEIVRILLNDIKGDTLDEKQNDTLRIMFQNINSLRPNNTDKWEATLKQMVEFKVDIVGLCETSVNWKKAVLKKLFQLKANKILKNPCLTTSTTNINYDENYLPGGCCQITANTWTTRCESKIYDDFRLGRWIGNTYRVSTTKKLHVVSAYRVCESNPSAKSSLSTAAQQHTMLVARG
jgi:hypothetical protein